MKALRSCQSSIACVLLVLYLPACTSTHLVAVPTPAQLVEAAQPPSIRVTRTDGMLITLRSPTVRGDSLVGLVGAQDAPRTVSVSLRDLSSASVEKPSAISWQRGTPTPARFVEAERPQSIRVTRTNGTMLTVKSPVVRGDSLLGSVTMEGTVPSTGVALSDVGTLSVTKASAGKTLLLVGGITLGVIAAVWIAAAACGDCMAIGGN